MPDLGREKGHKEIICLTNRNFMVFSLAFGGLILPCNGSLTLNLLCISDCYVIPEGTWRSRGRGTGDFIVTNPHYLVSRSCIVTLLSSCHSFLLSLANTFVSAPLLLPFPCPQCFLGSGSDVSCVKLAFIVPSLLLGSLHLSGNQLFL